jgi:repressor LexA
MMARKRQKGLGEQHIKVMEVLKQHLDERGYPPSIREICDQADISSTSVANYYLDQLEAQGYIARDKKVSRGLRLMKSISEAIVTAQETVVTAVQETIGDMLRIPIVGSIVASNPVTAFGGHPDEMIDVARSLLPKQHPEELFALQVRGDSMIDAMVNDGDIVIMRPAHEARNGEMVAVWLTDRDETTLKYFFRENGKVRLQPANPTMAPILIEKPETVQIQGKVVMVVRQLEMQ